ncbi:MAG TPA: Gfo/Idh/MocA family oxidoreductase [Candidatus Dormibacteraeota bacterium]
MKVLVLSDPARAACVAALAADLSAAGPFEVEQSSDVDRLLDLAGVGAIYVDWSDAITARHAGSLSEFTHRGGGVIAAGATLASWATHPSVVDLAGWSPDGRTVSCELVIGSADGSDTAFRIRDRVHILPDAPAGATALLLAPWRYTSQVVAYSRPAGAGQFVYVGLAHDTGAYAEQSFRRVVVRTLHHVANVAVERAAVGVGLLGFGALGPAHASAIEAVPGLELRGICDRAPQRREAAQATGAKVVESAARLLEDPSIDVVVVSLPPVAHADAVLEALEANKNVVCEKPFALRVADCDSMMACAAQRGLSLTVFQNRRWDPDYVALERTINAGAVGEPFYMESFVGGFAHPCNYWHSHEPISGGAVYDWGSHYIDWILQLFAGEVTAVRSVAHKRVWHDVTNADQASVEIQFSGGRQAFFMQSDVAAASKPKWYVLGTAGAVVGEWQERTESVRGPDGELDERRVRPTDLPARVVVLRPDGDGGAHRETLSLPARDRLAFYRNLTGHLLHGEPLAVTATEARRVVAVMEAATESAAHGGALIEMIV